MFTGRRCRRVLFSRMIEERRAARVRLDAACVVVNLFRIPQQPGVTDQCIQNILRLKPQCDHYRHAVDDRAAGVPTECEGRWLHGGW